MNLGWNNFDVQFSFNQILFHRTFFFLIAKVSTVKNIYDRFILFNNLTRFFLRLLMNFVRLVWLIDQFYVVKYHLNHIFLRNFQLFCFIQAYIFIISFTILNIKWICWASMHAIKLALWCSILYTRLLSRWCLFSEKN